VSHQPEDSHHEAEPILTSDVIGLDKNRAIFAARLHDRFGGRGGRLYAGRRPGTGRRHQDDTDGLTAGDAKIKVTDAKCRLFARPNGVTNPPVVVVAMKIFGLHEISRRDATPAKLGAFAVAPDYYFRKGVDLTKVSRHPALLPT